jgi:hypothetical protein
MPGIVESSEARRSARASGPVLAVDRSDPLVEQLDQRERLGHGAAPDRGHTACLE